MHTPTPAQWLQVWERGGELSAAARSLLLLGCSCDEYSAEALAALPVGRRDTLLLQLRARLFGEAVDVVASCPHCAAPIEASFRCADLLLSPDSEASAPTLEHVVFADGVPVTFRLPDSNDLLALEHCAGAIEARQLLLARCVLAAGHADAEGEHAMSPSLQAELAQAMAQGDPQADLQLALCCPQCEHAWQPPFDIARFLWQELHAWALNLLREVDALAQAYHWTEADILGLSPRRRQAYLELCAS